jgi:hypothetical protein
MKRFNEKKKKMVLFKHMFSHEDLDDLDIITLILRCCVTVDLIFPSFPRETKYKLLYVIIVPERNSWYMNKF